MLVAMMKVGGAWLGKMSMISLGIKTTLTKPLLSGKICTPHGEVSTAVACLGSRERLPLITLLLFLTVCFHC